LLLGALLSPARSRGEGAGSDLERARVLAGQAMDAFEQRDYPRAHRLLEDAYRAYPSGKLQYSLGKVHEVEGNPLAALLAYERYLRDVPAGEREPDRAAEVDAAIARLSRKVGRLRIEPGADGWFQLDDGPRGPAQGAPAWVLPGAHRVRFRAGVVAVLL